MFTLKKGQTFPRHTTIHYIIGALPGAWSEGPKLLLSFFI